MRKIKINSHDLGRYDDVTPFIVTENELELQITLPPQSGEYFLVAECGGRKYKNRLTRDRTVVLRDLPPGTMQSTVKHYLRGNLVREYQIEPLRLIEVDNSLKAIPMLSEILDRLNTIEAKQCKTAEALGTVNKRLKKCEEYLIGD